MIYKNMKYMILTLSILGTHITTGQETQQIQNLTHYFVKAGKIVSEVFTINSIQPTAVNKPITVATLHTLLQKPHAIEQMTLLSGAALLYGVSMYKLWKYIRGDRSQYFLNEIADVIAGVVFIMPAMAVTTLFALPVTYMHNHFGDGSILNSLL